MDLTVVFVFYFEFYIYCISVAPSPAAAADTRRSAYGIKHIHYTLGNNYERIRVGGGQGREQINK